jgi:hypothetical protein
MMQEAAAAASSAQSDYGPLSGLVQTAGWLISSVFAIGLSWRRGGKWIPYQEDLPKAAERIGGVLTAVAVALLWSLYNSWTAMPFLSRTALFTAVAAVVSFLIYAFLVSLQTYQKDVSTATSERFIKIVGGFTLTPRAQKKRKTQSIQAMFKDAAYDPDAIWERPGRALAQGLFALFFIAMTFSGTVALSSAAMVLMISQTPTPPVAVPILSELSLVVFESAASKIATLGGPEAGPVQPTGYRVTVDNTLIGRASADSAANGAVFQFGHRAGSWRMTVTNDNSATWTCVINISAEAKLYAIAGIVGDTCQAGPVTQSALDDFLKRRKSTAPPPITDKLTTEQAFTLVVLDSAAESVEASPRYIPKGSEMVNVSPRFRTLTITTSNREYDVSIDHTIVGRLSGVFLAIGDQYSVPPQTFGTHKIVLASLTSEYPSIECEMDVAQGVRFYALNVEKDSCKVSRMTEVAYNEFMIRTRRSITAQDEGTLRKILEGVG